MTKSKRIETRRMIRQLARDHGFSSRFSKRSPLSLGGLARVPRGRGVYRIYSHHDLVYIGASCSDIRNRLNSHLESSLEGSSISNAELSATLSEGSCEFDWLITPFPGWIEEFHLIECEEDEGAIPVCNTHKRSNLLFRCPY